MGAHLQQAEGCRAGQGPSDWLVLLPGWLLLLLLLLLEPLLELLLELLLLLWARWRARSLRASAVQQLAQQRLDQGHLHCVCKSGTSGTSKPSGSA